jgi:hypothetical protein
LNELSPGDGYRINDSRQGSGAGTAVAGLGDLTRDGVPDAIVGAIGARDGQGAAYVVYGQRTAAPAELDLARLQPSRGYAAGGVAGANAGWGVADAGDVNGDGTNEAWVWAPNYVPTSSTQGANLLVGLPRPTASARTGRAVLRSGRLAAVRVSCSAPPGVRCSGALRLLRGRDIVANAGYSLAAGRETAVALTVSPRIAALVEKRRRLKLVVRAVTVAQPPAPAVVRNRQFVLAAR